MTEGLLVLNAGSSSVKFALFEHRAGAEPELRLRGELAGIGRASSFEAWTGDGRRLDTALPGDVADHHGALTQVFDWLDRQDEPVRVAAVGHRIVHGGGRRLPERLTPELLVELEQLVPLAPHHQPHNLAAVKAVLRRDASLPQIACFDTAFHAGQPKEARWLSLPREYAARGIVRYGFHGLSYEYVVSALPARNGGQLPKRLIVAHLGNGASLAAIKDGAGVATTMGFSTLDGVMMATRSGSMDPGVLLHLMREEGLGEPELSDLLYNRCGLLGVSGISADMRVLLQSSEPAALEAVEMYCYSLSRAVGSLTAALGGLDALVFTAGVGANSPEIRQRVCARLEWLGLRLDETANLRGPGIVSFPDSAVAVWALPTNEELIIARHTARLLTTGSE